MDYHEVLETPIRWQDAPVEGLPEAIRAFFAYWTNKSNTLTEEHLALVIQWCQYYIQAPCWMMSAIRLGTPDQVARTQFLVNQSRDLKTFDSVRDWVYLCLNMGIDPF